METMVQTMVQKATVSPPGGAWTRRCLETGGGGVPTYPMAHTYLEIPSVQLLEYTPLSPPPLSLIAPLAEGHVCHAGRPHSFR